MTSKPVYINALTNMKLMKILSFGMWH